MFWKEVKRMRKGEKGEQTRDEMVKDVNGQILQQGVGSEEKVSRIFGAGTECKMSGKQIQI